MILSLNPSEEKIQELISLSKDKAARWLKDNETGDVWYWPSDGAIHKEMQDALGITDYEKGIAIDHH